MPEITKNLLNFVKVMPKILVDSFFSGHGVYLSRRLPPCRKIAYNTLPLNIPRNISMVCVDCEFYCARPSVIMLRIVCCKQNIQTVSLPNDSAGATTVPHHFCNICRIPSTCICPREYSCGDTAGSDMQNVSHTGCKSTSFCQCVVLYGHSSAF